MRMSLMGLFLFVLVFSLMPSLGFAQWAKYEFNTDLWMDNTTYNYNNSLWTWTPNDRYFYNVQGWNTSRVIVPMVTVFREQKATDNYWYHWDWGTWSNPPSLIELFLLNNNTWYNGSFVNQTPTGSTTKIGQENGIVKDHEVSHNIAYWYDWMYNNDWISVEMNFTGGSGYFEYAGAGNTTNAPYIYLNQTSFYTSKATADPASKYVYFDFESGNLTVMNTDLDWTAFVSAYPATALMYDFQWDRALNRIWALNPAGGIRYMDDTSDENNLDAVPCSALNLTSMTEYGLNPAGTYTILCFNLTHEHAVPFYGVIKVLESKDESWYPIYPFGYSAGNFTFYWRLYSGAETFAIGSVQHSPVSPVSGDNVTVTWITGQLSDSRVLYRYRPTGVNTSFGSWESVYDGSLVYSHSLVIPSVLGNYDYEYKIHSISANATATATSGVYNFTVSNVTVPTTTTTTTTIAPSTTCDGGKIQSVSYGDTNPAIGQTVPITIYVTNNGSLPCNYTIGLSIGNITTGVFCNRDCYADCTDEERHTVDCDYVTTGIVGAGHTVGVTRTFTFLDGYFDNGKYYDVLTAVYDAPYKPYIDSFDYFIDYGRFYVVAPAVKDISAFAVSAVAVPSNVRRGGDIKVTTYILNNGTSTYNFKLGMSIGLWSNITNGAVYGSYQIPDVMPCNLECYTDNLGDWVYLSIPPNYTAPFTRRFRIPDYFLQNNYFDVVIGTYAGDELIAYTYFRNISFIPTAPPVEQPEDLMEGLASMFGSILGIETLLAVQLIAMIIAISVGGYIGYKTQHSELGLGAMIALILIFTMVGWLDAWIAVILAVFSALLVARYGRQMIGGGG